MFGQSMKKLSCGVAALLSAGACVAACTDGFSSSNCRETRTCPRPPGDGGESAAGDGGGSGEPIAGATTAGTPAGGGANASATGGAGGQVEPENGGMGSAGAPESPVCPEEQDFESDSKNCGSCGHDCLGGDCVLGECQPIEIARNQGRLFTIAVDRKFIYWAGDGSVVAKKSIDNTGTVSELVPASAKESVYDWALVGQTLYWSNDWKDNGVRGCALPSCGNGPQLLVPGTTPPRDVIFGVEAGALYYTQGASVWQKLLPAGANTQLTPATNTAVELAADGAYVYWSEYEDGVSVIRRVGLNGGASSPVAGGLGYLNELSVSGSGLYVLEDPRNGAGNTDARILKIPLPAGVGMEAPPVFSAAGFSTRSMTVDDTGVYWTQRDPEATIRYCPHQECANSVVLAESVKPWGIVTDELAIYWTTEDGQVMKLAK